MKKIIRLLTAVQLFSLCLSGCSQTASKTNTAISEGDGTSARLVNDFDSKTNQKVSIGDYTIEIPSTWEKRDEGYYTGFGTENYNMIVLKTVTDTSGFTPEFLETNQELFAKTLYKTLDENYELTSFGTKKINGVLVLFANGKIVTQDKPFSLDACLFSNPTDNTLSSVLLADNLEEADDYSSDFSKIMNSITLKDNIEIPAEPAKTAEPEVSTAKEETAEETDPAVTGSTLGEKNALKSAQAYLKYSSFSYSGLINQLEYEGYSTEEATFAADHVGADWSEQAVLSAESYLKYSSFNYSGLINQLEYEGFSNEEAVYGADHCGADWYEQAVKTANSYLEYSSFSRSGLYDQLIYEGFTEDQVNHALTEVGY